MRNVDRYSRLNGAVRIASVSTRTAPNGRVSKRFARRATITVIGTTTWPKNVSRVKFRVKAAVTTTSRPRRCDVTFVTRYPRRAMFSPPSFLRVDDEVSRVGGGFPCVTNAISESRRNNQTATRLNRCAFRRKRIIARIKVTKTIRTYARNSIYINTGLGQLQTHID